MPVLGKLEITGFKSDENLVPPNPYAVVRRPSRKSAGFAVHNHVVVEERLFGGGYARRHSRHCYAHDYGSNSGLRFYV
jgi:hypothetical protein